MTSESQYIKVGGSTGDWTNGSEMEGSPDATCGVSTGDAEIQTCYPVQFSVPSLADVVGIKVEVEAACSDDNDQLILSLYCTSKGASSTETLVPAGANCASVTTETYGGLTSLWTWTSVTGSDVNGTDFYVKLEHNDISKGGDIYVDSVYVTVYYDAFVAVSASVGIAAAEKKSVEITEVAAVGVAAVDKVYIAPKSVSHYIRTNGAFGQWTDDANVEGAPDASCIWTSTKDNTANVYPVQFTEIGDDDVVVGMKLTAKCAISATDGGNEIYMNLTSTTRSPTSNRNLSVTSTTNCSNVSDSSDGGESDLWGWTNVLGSDVNVEFFGSNFSSNTTETLYADSILITIYYYEADATSHYIKSGGASGDFTSDSNMEGAPDGSCAVSDISGGPKTETCYPVQFTEIEDTDTVYGIEINMKTADSDDSNTIKAELYCTSLGLSDFLDEYFQPTAIGTCSSAAIDSEGGNNELWGWGAVVGSDINGTDFYVKVEHNTGADIIYWDSIEITIWHTPSTGAGFNTYPTASVGVAGALGDWVVTATRSATITIAPSQQYASKVHQTAALGLAAALENQPKTLQSAAISIAAAEDFPAYQKACAAALGITTAEQYAAFIEQAAAMGIDTTEEYSALHKVAAAIGVAAVEHLALHFTKEVSASLSILTAEQYASLTKQAAAVGMTAALTEFRVKALLDAAVSVAESQQFASSMFFSESVGVAEAIQLAALKKAAGALGIGASEDLTFHAYLDAIADVGLTAIDLNSVLAKLVDGITITAVEDLSIIELLQVQAAIGIAGTVDFPKYLKALSASVTATGDVDFAVFITQVAGIDVSESIDIGRLKLMAASIGITGTTATDVLIKRAAAIGISSSEQFSALLNVAAAISIGDTVLFPKYLKVLAASLTVDGAVTFPVYLKAVTAAVSLTAAIENQAKTLQTAALGLSASTQFMAEILLAAGVGIGATWDSWLPAQTEYCIAAISIATGEKYSVTKLFSENVTLAATLINMAKIFEAAGISVGDVADATQTKKALDAAIGITASESFPAFKKALAANIGILAEFDTDAVLVEYCVAGITVTAAPTLAALIKIAESVDVNDDLVPNVKKFFAALIGIAVENKMEPKKLLDMAISMVPVWSSPTYTEMIKWLIGKVSQPDRLKADWGAVDGLSTDADFFTEALSLSSGEWSDGAWSSDGYFGGPFTYSLDAAEKVAGQYSCKVVAEGTTDNMGFYFLFDGTPDLSGFDYIVIDVKYIGGNTDHNPLYGSNPTIIIGSYEGVMEYNCTDSLDTDWHHYVFDLKNPDYLSGNLDFTDTEYFEFYLNHDVSSYTHTIWVDNISFISHDHRLKAALTQPDRLKAVFDLDG